MSDWHTTVTCGACWRGLHYACAVTENLPCDCAHQQEPFPGESPAVQSPPGWEGMPSITEEAAVDLEPPT